MKEDDLIKIRNYIISLSSTKVDRPRHIDPITRKTKEEKEYIDKMYNNSIKIKPNTVKGDILLLIGICGQLQYNRFSYYFKEQQSFRRAVGELESANIIVTTGQLKKTLIDNGKDLKNLSLTTKGKIKLKELYPEVYRFYISMHKKNITVELTPDRISKKKIKDVRNSIYRAIVSLKDEKAKKILLENFKYIDDEYLTLKDCNNFLNNNEVLKEYYSFKPSEDPVNMLRRVLSKGSVLGFLYNNGVFLTNDSKHNIYSTTKYNIKEDEFFFYTKHELIKAVGPNINFVKCVGVTFSQDRVFYNYVINKKYTMWSYEGEKKFISNITMLENKKFHNKFKERNMMIFYRDDEFVIDYICSTKNKDLKESNPIMDIESEFDNIYYIPLYVNKFTLEDKHYKLDEINYYNNTFQILKRNINKKYIEAYKLNIINSNKFVVSDDKSYLCDFYIKDKFSDEIIKYFSVNLDFNISKLKRLLYSANRHPNCSFELILLKQYKNIIKVLDSYGKISDNLKIIFLDGYNNYDCIFPRNNK